MEPPSSLQMEWKSAWTQKHRFLNSISNPHVYLCKDKIHPPSDGDRNWANKYPSRHKSLMDPLEESSGKQLKNKFLVGNSTG